MLNRKYTEAMEKLAKAQRQLADAEEKANANFLKWYFAEEAPQNAATARDHTDSSEPPRKETHKK